jgi:hypothetical protein
VVRSKTGFREKSLLSKTEETMNRIDIAVELTSEASKEFSEIQNHPEVAISGCGEKYLEKLIRFPWEKWRDIGRDWNSGVFKSGDHVPFDIRGKIFRDPDGGIEKVLITRFRWVKSSLKKKFKFKIEGRLFAGSARLN